jgi:hypothetical protein
LKLL